MEWRESRLLAIAYLKRSGDEKHKAVLYDDRLVLVSSERRMNFDLDQVNGLTLGRRKLLLPLILGGILLPLLLVGLFTAPVRPHYFLILLFPASLLLYLGWEGQQVLTVLQHGKEIDLPLGSSGYSLKAFVGFVNSFIRSMKPGKKRERFYFVNRVDCKYGDVTYAYTFLQYHQLAEINAVNVHDFAAIDPLLLQTPVEYRFDIRIGEMRPVILGQIDLLAIENL